MSLSRRLASEAIGTALLLSCVVGSGVMGERLAGGNVAIALLANTAATGAVLVALILAFGPISAHFNPVVTLVEAWRGQLPRSEVLPYLAVEVLAAILGVATAHLMFDLPVFSLSAHVRSGASQMLSEFVATFGLIGVILAVGDGNPRAVPYAVGAYITAAYWFTASTSFANPAVTLARALSDTFAGIRPVDVPGFWLAQIAGGASAAVVFGWLLPSRSTDAGGRATRDTVKTSAIADRRSPAHLHREAGS